ncbi:hypothetical protein [Streptomyces sp. NPDC059918]|uniref:hypothetical protein n=1 Tax=unclassified Streptomyces TaxID=2593676 RepID=UPI00364A7FD5
MEEQEDRSGGVKRTLVEWTALEPLMAGVKADMERGLTKVFPYGAPCSRDFSVLLEQLPENTHATDWLRGFADTLGAKGPSAYASALEGVLTGDPDVLEGLKDGAVPMDVVSDEFVLATPEPTAGTALDPAGHSASALARSSDTGAESSLTALRSGGENVASTSVATTVHAVARDAPAVAPSEDMTQVNRALASMMAKVRKDARNFGGSVVEAVDRTSDPIRVTLSAEPESYTETVKKVVAGLLRAGWKVQKFQNFWVNPWSTGHRGINSQWRFRVTGDWLDAQSDRTLAELGGWEGAHDKVWVIEVQFHTPDSYRIKDYGRRRQYDEVRATEIRGDEEKRIRAAAEVKAVQELSAGHAPPGATVIHVPVSGPA